MQITCPRCHGERKIRCPSCHGEGERKRFVCVRCIGRGLITPEVQEQRIGSKVTAHRSLASKGAAAP
jgi:hypothetical protein